MSDADGRLNKTPLRETSRQRWVTRLALLVAAVSLAGTGLMVLERMFYYPVQQHPMTESAGTPTVIEPPIAASVQKPAATPVITAPAPAGGNADELSKAERLALFKGFQSWRSRPAALPPPPSATLMNSRVVIHYRTGSGANETVANGLAALAGSVAGSVQTRVVPDTPSSPTVRFFHPEDKARARALAAALSASPVAGTWEIRDFGTFRPSPSVGTLEVWVPSR